MINPPMAGATMRVVGKTILLRAKALVRASRGTVLATMALRTG